MLMELRTVGLVWASSNSDQERDRTQEFAAKPDLQPDHMGQRWQVQVTLALAIESLPERYQQVVCLYYTKEMTMKEIGEVMGVDESRVSQIHKTALKKMAVALESEGLHSVTAF